ncbi:hypothetical protein [Salipiger thiooxidans]|uniref:hypothetical protein n=1 Tax=Salipiger thiooxidans TaxID=282683 RepID=UPI001CD554AC|nr:hypothetical protein [Salipiger thiooxidans]MCA0847919.1 hypothetical protein [Salipiger thiooxidans]
MPDSGHTPRTAPGSGIVLAALCGLPGLAVAALILATGSGWGWAVLAWALGGPAALSVVAAVSLRKSWRRAFARSCRRALNA